MGQDKTPATPHLHLHFLLRASSSLTVATMSAKAWWPTDRAPVFPVTQSEKQKLGRILNTALTSYNSPQRKPQGMGCWPPPNTGNIQGKND